MNNDEYTQGVIDALNEVASRYTEMVQDQELVEDLADIYEETILALEIEAEAGFDGEELTVE